MRIGYLTYGLDRSPTGIGRYSLELLQAIAAQPQAPTIVLLTSETSDPYQLWHQFEHHPLPGCSRLPLLLTLGDLELTYLAHRLQLDILHDPNGIAPFLGRASHVRRVTTIHDAFPYVVPQTHNRLDNWRYQYHLPVAAQRADMVVTVSECSRRDLLTHLQLSPERITVIPEAVAAHFQPVADTAERRAILEQYHIPTPYLLYLGGITARKNIQQLYSAYAQVRAIRPNISLVIVGKRQWQTAAIDAALHANQLEPYVHFTGYVADQHLAALYSAAELFVFPSLYEGFGLPPLEAMACQTPVIVSNAASLPEVVGNAALQVDPYDVHQLADAIVQVLTQPTLRQVLCERGLRRAAHYSWKHTAQLTINLYQDLQERQRVRGRLPHR